MINYFTMYNSREMLIYTGINKNHDRVFSKRQNRYFNVKMTSMLDFGIFF